MVLFVEWLATLPSQGSDTCTFDSASRFSSPRTRRSSRSASAAVAASLVFARSAGGRYVPATMVQCDWVGRPPRFHRCAMAVVSLVGHARVRRFTDELCDAIVIQYVPLKGRGVPSDDSIAR